MAFSSDGPASKMQKLAERIGQLESALKQTRATLEVVRTTRVRRDRDSEGYRRCMQLATLCVMQKYCADESMLATVARLIMPKVAVDGCGAAGAGGFLFHVRMLMARPQVQRIAERVWNEPRSPKHVRIRQRAKKWATEYNIFAEVMKMNRQGVTPKRDDMIRLFRRHWFYSGDETDLLPEHLATKQRGYQNWMTRFRQFWHVSYGKLPLRGDMSLDVKKQKVCLREFHFANRKRAPFCEPFWGPILGTMYTVFVTQGPENGSFFGSRFGTLRFEWQRELHLTGDDILAVGAMAVAEASFWL